MKVGGEPVKTYDPRAIFFRVGHTTDNNISLNGATDKSKYLISYSYLRNDGIVPTTSYMRNSFFAKFSNQITNNLTANVELNYISSVNHRTQEGNGLTNPLWTIYSAPITWNPEPETWADGTQRLYRTLSRNNPFFLINNSGFVSNVNRVLPVGTLVYAPLKWLSVTERIGADIIVDNSNYYEANTINSGVFGSDVGGVANRTVTTRNYNNDFFIDMHKQLTNDLFASLILGDNIVSQFKETYKQSSLGLTVPNFYNISNGSTVAASDYLKRYRKVGYYAQANFDYKKVVELSLTGRYDGTSVLSTSKNYYPYGSVGLGFNFSELMHTNANSFFNFGKLRVSYSSVGNDNLDPYSLTTPYLGGAVVNNISFPYTGINGFQLSGTLGNQNLTNEKLNESEIGLELKFFKNRLSFEGSYFDRESKDLLTNLPKNFSGGFTHAKVNLGKSQNKGIELLVSGTPIKTQNFTWDVSVNFTRIRSKVLSLPVPSVFLGGFSGDGGVYLFTGKAYGVLYGSKYLRDTTNKSTLGQIIIDANGAPESSPDYGIIGDPNPDFNAGISNTFSYKEFSLSFLFDWKQGGDILNFDDHYNWFYGTPKATENRTNLNIIKGVTETGQVNTTPISTQAYYTDISSISEATIEKGTYVKLRNLSMSYSINPTVLKGSFIKSLVFTVAGNNLWIYKPFYTGSDPEASLVGGGNGQGLTNYMTPTSRSFLLGLKVSF